MSFVEKLNRKYSVLSAGDFKGEDEDEDYFSDGKIKEALKFMKESGLVPKGVGKPTRPSTAAEHDVALDEDLGAFYLIVYSPNKQGGSVWLIADDEGKAYPVSSFTGKFKPDKGVKIFKDGRYRDYMSLKGIRTVLDIVDPKWDEER